MTELLKADFHIHTRYSMDCTTHLEEIISRCLETGINCIAVTDHDAIEGAFEMQRLAPFTVIIGEEILTPQGEIIGMFLKEKIPTALPIEEAASRIRAQGGLVCLPHPFDGLRGLKINRQRLEALAAQIDMLEVFNARSPLLRYSNKARDFARKFGIPGTAGSDAHSPAEIGNTYVEMPEFKGRDDFLQALQQGKAHGHRASPFVHLNSTRAKLKFIMKVSQAIIRGGRAS